MANQYKVEVSRSMPTQTTLNEMAADGYVLVNIQQRNGKVYVFYGREQ